MAIVRDSEIDVVRRDSSRVAIADRVTSAATEDHAASIVAPGTSVADDHRVRDRLGRAAFAKDHRLAVARAPSRFPPIESS